MAGLELARFTLARESGVCYEEYGGVRVAVDEVYEVLVNGARAGEIVAMPPGVEDAGYGLALADYRARSPGEVRVEARPGVLSITLPRAAPAAAPGVSREGCGARGPGAVAPGHDYTWGDVRAVAGDFASRTAGSLYRLSAHTVALYNLDESRVVVAHDTSRHTAVLKAIGMAWRLGLLRGRLAAASTGRASADMVLRLAAAGVGLVVTLRGPLASGVRAARMAGVTLVSNAKTGRGRGLVLLAGGLEGDAAPGGPGGASCS